MQAEQQGAAAPTDAEIIALARGSATAEPGRDGYVLPISFARAVLERWGQPTPPTEIDRGLLAHIVDEAFDGAIEDTSPIEDIYRIIVRQYGNPSGGQPTVQAAPLAVVPTYDQVVSAWNAQADEHNQWGELGEDEKIEWAAAYTKATPPAVVEPLTRQQLREAYHRATGCTLGGDIDLAERVCWVVEAAHGIKKGDSHG